MPRKSVIISLAAAALAASAPAVLAAPAATPLEKVSTAVKPGIVYLESTFQATVGVGNDTYVGNGHVFAITKQCSGFFVNSDGYIGSAGHCVDDDEEAQTALIDQAARWSYAHDDWRGVSLRDLTTWAERHWKVRSAQDPRHAGADLSVKAAYGVNIGGIPTGKALPARVIGYHDFEHGDVSLLKIEADHTPALALADDSGIDIGTPAISIGYPAEVNYVTDPTFDPSFKDGAVSSLKTVGGGLRKVYEVSAAIAPGMSGGPTVDDSGRVIGINSFRPTGTSEAFDFVSPVSELAALLQDKGVTGGLSATDRQYRAGLVAYFAGNRTVAVKAFDAVLAQNPQHQLAEQYRARALQLPLPVQHAQPQPQVITDEGGVPVLVVVPLAAILLAGVTAGGVAAGRRRGASAAAPIAAPRPSGTLLAAPVVTRPR